MLTFNVVRPRDLLGVVSLFGLVFAGAGCSSPPSVAPLLRVSQQAMLAEVEQLNVDVTRDAEQMRQSRVSLDAAFDADMDRIENLGELDATWVREAMGVYVPTREALVRHEAALATERLARQDNLRAAAEAQQRALQLLEQQDRLITETTHFSVWRLLQLENPVLP